MSRYLRPDCRNYRGSRPCDPHKKTGSICESCAYFEAVEGPVCIIKLGAMGDVLRTLALLPDIRARHPNAPIVWITQGESLPLLWKNPGIASVAVYEPCQRISLPAPPSAVYSLDNSEEGVAIDAMLKGGRHYGFRAGGSGKCEGTWPDCDPTLFELGLWDDLKKSNKESYLKLLARAGGFIYSGGRPELFLQESERLAGSQLLSDLPGPIIGINTDAGTRWLRKQYNLEHVEVLTQKLLKADCSVALLGGTQVREFNTGLAAASGPRVRALETMEDVRVFCAVIGHLDLLVTGDTLAMHAAWAEGTPLVALFGPTSLAEIDLGDDDVKLASELPCLGCYLHTCDVDPHCMDLLKPERVMAAIQDRLAQGVAR